jgi:hypothetical protein
MLRLVPALASAGALSLWGFPAAANEALDVCAEAVESMDEGMPVPLDIAEDCAPVELLPDVSCEDAPSTFWPAAVDACERPLFKVRSGVQRGPRLQLAAPGRRPLKDVASGDLGSFRDSRGRSGPLPHRDLTLARDPIIVTASTDDSPPATRVPFVWSDPSPLAPGHERRLERPPNR